MYVIFVLAVICLWLIGGMLLEDLDDADRWARRTLRKKMREARSGDRSL